MSVKENESKTNKPNKEIDLNGLEQVSGGTLVYLVADSCDGNCGGSIAKACNVKKCPHGRK